MIDHCVAAFRKEQEEEAFKVYVTDCLSAIVHNTARQEDVQTMNYRFREILHPVDKIKEERSEAEQAQSIRQRFKDKFN